MGIFVRRNDDDPHSDDARIIPFAQRRGLTASAQRVRLTDRDDIERLQRRGRTAWQARAWEYFDVIGEIGFAFEMKASVVSRARLYPAFITDAHEPPVQTKEVGKGSDPEDPDAQQPLPEDFVRDADAAMDRILSTKGGMAGLLRGMSLNFDVAGECYLVQTPAKIGSAEPESWDIKSVDEIVVGRDGRVGIKNTRLANEREVEILPQTAFVGRMWRNHPRYSGEAFSSMHGVLESCADLLLFSRSNRATARSRLNAGALFIPDGLSASAMPEDPELGDDESLPPVEDHDEFEEELILAMTTPIADEESASAVVPLIIRGPEDLGEKIKLIKFERSFDQVLAERADRALERIMQGIDVPKDLVMGLANVKYSNAVVINLQLYKAHIEPLLLLIADALTFVWLRPALRAMGHPAELINRVTVWFDATDIVIQSDKEAMADTGFDKDLVSGAAWRRAHGFNEADKPEAAELALKKILTGGQISPELTEAILQQLAPELFNAARAQSQAQSGAPLPPEVAQALGVPPSDAPVEPAPTDPSAPVTPPSPAPPPGTAPTQPPGTEAQSA